MQSAIKKLTESERLDWLRLYRSENVGPVTFFRLLEQFGSAAAALSAIPELAKRGGRKKPIAVYAKSAAEREIAALIKADGVLIAACEPDFPRSLASLDAAPILTAKGHVELFGNSAIAIVGARNASSAGRRMAHILAEGLGQGGFTVVSGMARGVDAAAHQASLQTGTIAVMAGGIDIIYPPENTGLYNDICAMGCVVSEMPPGTQPQATHFPRRNRLISGIGIAVVVVEATERSGSLITARLALDQGREIFAVPGSPLDPRARGPNRLIRDGATLVETADDIIFAMSDLFGKRLSEPAPNPALAGSFAVFPNEMELEKARTALNQLLGPTPVTVDEIVRQCQFSPSVVSVCLLEMELAGRLDRLPGSKVALKY